jgi:hypothetical protein
MKFQPGKSGNPAGKKKGPSKKQMVLTAFAADVVQGGAAKFKKEMDKLSGRAYTDTYLQLMEYVAPKLARVDHLDSGNNVRIITVTVANEANTNQLASLEPGN